MLKERLRKTKESEKRLEREKKRLDMENEKNQKKLKELNNIIQTKVCNNYQFSQGGLMILFVIQ